jgi:hypothetical protein
MFKGSEETLKFALRYAIGVTVLSVLYMAFVAAVLTL